MIFESLDVISSDTDSRGNPNVTASGTIQGFFGWSSARSNGRYSQTAGRGESSSITAQLYVQRGVSLPARFRVRRQQNGDIFTVVGRQQWDEDFPLDDGYDDDVDALMVFQVESYNG